MEFGWGPKAFWIISTTILLGSIWYAKRGREDPPNKSGEYTFELR
jgi:hypothetical protein